ncbi:MAG: AAA family ATPase [Clostridia bacterium]|nr:AAA family ATPase [Clostridia bacterium]
MYTTYLNRLTLVSDDAETDFLMHGLKRTCYNNIYPYKLFPAKGLTHVDLAPITVFYGGNGSGKTTLLNILAEKAQVQRHAAFNGSAFFAQYVENCALSGGEIPAHSQILTSDDVFDYVLNIRHLNDGIDGMREELLADYTQRKYASHRFSGMAEYDDWKESFDAKRRTQSRFVRERLMPNVDMASNGESAMRYFVQHITEEALYLLDEPENSLSVGRQQELCEYIRDSARYYGCQFVIATHSPILLAIPDARIYDLDACPVVTKRWTELENVRRYFDFFEAHRQAFLTEPK